MGVRVRRMAVVLLVGAAAVVATAALAGDRPRPTDPKKAAAALVAQLRMDSRASGSFGASGVLVRSGHRWLAVGTTTKKRTRVAVYGWSGSAWKLRGTVIGAPLFPAQWISGASL